MDETLVTSTALDILRYLRSHPHSADTLEGIQQWWIGSDENEIVVQLALERLEADCVIEKMRVGDRLLWRKRRLA